MTTEDIESNDQIHTIPLLRSHGVRAFFTDKKCSLGVQYSIAPRAAWGTSIAGAKEDIYFPKQIHSAECIAVEPTQIARQDGDAVITNDLLRPIGIITADCIPLFLFDRVQRAIGLVHGGWRGVAQGIVSRTIDMMRLRYGTKATDVIACLGPAIHACCYEVQNDVAVQFPNHIEARNNSLFLDLPRCVIDELISRGVPKNDIYNPQLCTRCLHETYFSYRKEGKGVGKNISVMMLVPHCKSM